ncbi:MAG: carbohydrate ABC transporter permease [Treponema sp.]|jgi:putative aldouronate transport system permease protein|nr:carbohydrate ABC transporter permease [Treponema sp.]
MANTFKRKRSLKHWEPIDWVLFVVLTVFGLLVVIPFLNVVSVSLTTYKEYLTSPLIIFPRVIDLKAYKEIVSDTRIVTGYRTSFTIIAIGVPLSLLLCSSFGYALSRRNYPGRGIIFGIVLFTMLFSGGIVPLYLVIRALKLTNTLWSVIFVGGMNTFYMILCYNYFQTLPDSLVESARLDGASEWHILFRIILPLSLPIMATLTLFLLVDKWNEWFSAMIFIRRSDIQPLQLVLRSIIIDNQTAMEISSSMEITDRPNQQGIKMAAVLVTMLPIMCIYPFLQKHFAKGIMIGAIKA